jgi:putative AlgH/UPF0301 family transcriptional regulator
VVATTGKLNVSLLHYHDRLILTIFQLENEVRGGTWFVASVSKEVLFKSRDRMGTRRAKPLWTEIMELMGGKYKEIRDQLYQVE